MVPVREANVVIGVTGSQWFSPLQFPERYDIDDGEIMSGMEISQLDAFVTSAWAEVANIISGNALTLLNENDYQCDIVPPRIVVGTGNALSMATRKGPSSTTGNVHRQFGKCYFCGKCKNPARTRHGAGFISRTNRCLLLPWQKQWWRVQTNRTLFPVHHTCVTLQWRA